MHTDGYPLVAMWFYVYIGSYVVLCIYWSYLVLYTCMWLSGSMYTGILVAIWFYVYIGGYLVLCIPVYWWLYLVLCIYWWLSGSMYILVAFWFYVYIYDNTTLTLPFSATYRLFSINLFQ